MPDPARTTTSSCRTSQAPRRQRGRPSRQPIDWREVLRAHDNAALPFRGLCLEAAGATVSEERPMMAADRIVEPVGGWQAFRAASRWGENSLFVEDWFHAGEALQHATCEVQIDEPDRWERALLWVRTLLVGSPKPA